MRVRVLDYESSGETPDGDKAGLVEIAYTDVVSTGADLAGGPTEWIVEEGKSRLCNPGVPIPPETSAIHNLVDEDVAAEPNWKSLLATLIKHSREHDGVDAFAAHSANFELAWIYPDWIGATPLKMICTYKSALRLWQDAPTHSNAGLRYWRKPAGIERQKTMPVHRAGPDSYVTAFLLRDMLNDGCTVEQMLAWTAVPALTLRCKIGAYRNGGAGTPWAEVDDGLLHWILGKDFDEDTVYTVKYHLNLRREEAKAVEERDALNAQLRANGLPEEPGGSNPLVDSSQGNLAL